ncbi:MAG: hypothetical protein LBQ05_00785 [Christensenellaceae bacterium]|jgi:hypothetical protein|nr:hypothetical protein [Christensenellaceae bacterium]
MGKEYTQKDFEVTENAVANYLAKKISGRDLANIAYEQMQGMPSIEVNIDEQPQITPENLQGEIAWWLDALSFIDDDDDKENIKIVKDTWALIRVAFMRYKLLTIDK